MIYNWSINKNFVSAWDYCSEEELFEGIINGEFWSILDNSNGLEKYNEDYNKEYNKK